MSDEQNKTTPSPAGKKMLEGLTEALRGTRRMANGPNKLCPGCGRINNRLNTFCPQCEPTGGIPMPSASRNDPLTDADRAYLEWKAQRDAK